MCIFVQQHIFLHLRLYLLNVCLLSFNTNICMHICLGVRLCIYLNVCLSVYLCIYLSICLCVCLNILLCVCPYIYLNILLCVYLSVCLLFRKVNCRAHNPEKAWCTEFLRLIYRNTAPSAKPFKPISRFQRLPAFLQSFHKMHAACRKYSQTDYTARKPEPYKPDLINQ